MRESSGWVGGSAGKRAGYREAVLNFNFKEVSFSSRLNVKTTFEGRVAGKKSDSLQDCWGLTTAQKRRHILRGGHGPV